MKREEENLIQKIFGSSAMGGKIMPLRSNVYSGGSHSGYSPIGQTSSRIFDMDRKSPLLGNSTPSFRLSSWYEKLSELKGYQLLDISKLATNFFVDYIINFLTDDSNSQQVCTIIDEEGNTNEQVSERINHILTKDIKIFDFIKSHAPEYVYYGGYFSMLSSSHDEAGHLTFRVEELNDPVTVVIKRKRGKDGEIEEKFLAKGDDNVVYEIPKDEVIYLGSNNLRLTNDLTPEWNKSGQDHYSKPKVSEESNRDKVLKKESYLANEPLFYSLVLKVKELVIKELLVSLLSLRDLSSIQIFLLQFDKSVPLESANELCARTTKLANTTNELSSFLTSQFDVVSFIENTLTQSAKFVPDYNSTIGSKNAALPLDKLSDKLIDIMQSIDTCRNNVLGPLGLPSTLMDSTSGSKWQVLQQSERANSRVAGFIAGIKDSVTSLVCSLYHIIYSETLDPSFVKLHIFEKTSVEFNNQINQSESVSGLVQSIAGIITNSLQTLDAATPFLDPAAFLGYIQNLVKDVDPNTESIITQEGIARYVEITKAKSRVQLEQLGIDPSILEAGEQNQ